MELSGEPGYAQSRLTQEHHCFECLRSAGRKVRTLCLRGNEAVELGDSDGRAPGRLGFRIVVRKGFRHIAPIDEGGVAIAAIQGLNQKVDELKSELSRRGAENAELKQRLEVLEQAIRKGRAN